jgi:hypothetical protein
MIAKPDDPTCHRSTKCPLDGMDPRELRQAFAANLRRLRHAKGISEEGLAYDEAGVNRTYISKL